MKKIILYILLIFWLSSCIFEEKKPVLNESDKKITTEFLKERIFQWNLELSNLWLSQIPDFSKTILSETMTWTLADEITSISFMSNKITKINWENLLWFPNLKEINFSFNEIKSTKWIGILKDLRILNFVNLSQNWLSDLSEIKNLTQIKELNLNFNEIKTVWKLKWLKNLTNLQLAHNKLIDISQLSELKNLLILKVEFNEISDISKILENKEMQLELFTTKYNLLDKKISDKIYEINIKNMEIKNWEEKMKIVLNYQK